jgi:hypothetical protein
MQDKKIPLSVRSVVLLTRLLDEAVEKRGELIHQRFKGERDPELDGLRERERKILQELNEECDRLEEMINLEYALYLDEFTNDQ